MNIEEFAVRNLDYFKRHTSGSTPFCMHISSSNPGAHVVIVGGTHGNEPGGVKAIVQLHRAFRNGEISLKRGKISFLLGNPKAYEKDVRYIDSDLNRIFVKQAPPSVEGKRALEIEAFLRDHDNINALLDLHSVSIGDFKLLVYTKDNHGYHVAPQDCYVVVPSLVVKPTDDDAGFLGRRTVVEGSGLEHL